MRKLILLFVLFLGVQQVIACGGYGNTIIYPMGKSLVQNPLILIDQKKSDIDILSGFEFYLLADNGKKINIEIIQRNQSPFYNQILLKPSKLLKKDSELSLRVTKVKMNEDFYKNETVKQFIDKVKERKWIVNIEEDNISPQYIGDISENFIYVNGAFFNCSFDDNTPVSIYDSRHILMEVRGRGGYRYIIPVWRKNGNFNLYGGDGYSNCHLKPNTRYTFKFRLMDFSGNKSEETKKITFKTKIDEYAKERKQKQKEMKITQRKLAKREKLIAQQTRRNQ